MNNMGISIISCADGVLDGCGRETFLEEAVHMAREDGL